MENAAGFNSNIAAQNVELTSLSPTELIARITDLELRLKSTTAELAALTASKSVSSIPALTSSQTKKSKPFNFSRYSTRHIALKFAYLGHRYNGFEHTNGGKAPLKPTIEETIWKALRKSRLIPTDVPEGCDASFDVVFGEDARKRLYWQEKIQLEIDWTGLAYSKCGRTDKGVSAFGQVIALRVRSNRPKSIDQMGDQLADAQVTENETAKMDSNLDTHIAFDDIKDELPYVSILNSILPPDIKILAWSANVDPTFDARFNCRERRYKYFFTNPAFCPTPGPIGMSHGSGEKASIREGWLDVEVMRRAAKKLEGLHDFRNFCKIDPGKQMSSCERRITFADIEEMPAGMGLNQFMADPRLNENGQNLQGTTTANHKPSSGSIDGSVAGPKVYAFAVHGTAFLWHQVRCMVAILFLIGQRLEQPELVDQLLDIAQNPGRPHYDMADDAPLVLWDCVFPGDDPKDDSGVKWIYAGDKESVPSLAKKSDSQYDGKFGAGGLVTDLWTGWREAKMKETLTAGLLSLALSQGDNTSLERGGLRINVNSRSRSQRVFDGDNFARSVGEYTLAVQKPKMETLEVQNAKYLAGKQARRDMKKMEGSDKT